ncbi:MAG: hypothetical protein JWN01_1149 [Patescibacteria group bacterium]|nr:hypothetical protein [Patescibacteria group bacterium]
MSELAKVATVLVALMSMGLSAGIADAATLSSASTALSDPRPSATSVNYTFTGSSVTSSNIKCVKAIFSTTPTGDTAPTGWSGASGSVTAASSTLVNSNGTGWTLATSDGTSSTGQKNVWQYTNATGVTPSTTTGATFIMAGITNSNTADTAYYLKVSTYDNINCSSNPVDNATVEFLNTNGSTLSLTVDNTLSFTVNAVSSSTSCDGATTTQASTATTIPFGTVTAASNGVVCQDLTAATNATNGYTIYSRYTNAPTNALSQSIADWTGTNTSPTTFPAAGTEAYGVTSNDTTLGTGSANRFTNGGQKWAALTASNAEVAYESAGVTISTYRIGHQVGISLTTKPGTYTTTVVYTCTPVY